MAQSTVWQTQIHHVVVLMMENRSFDQLLGDFRRINPACEGIDADNPGSNDAHGRIYRQQADAELSLPFVRGEAFDPMHEFANACAQIGPLDAPTMAGFAQDVYDAYEKHPVFGPDIARLTQRVMNYIPFGDTPQADPLPGLQGLARAFTVCDHWFSSLPGPTWPNRFFAMMGSAHGRVLMPSSWKDAVRGIKDFCDQICEESIFSLLADKGVSAGVYGDGELPYTLMVKSGGKGSGLDQFRKDAQAGRLPSFVWIEPDYSYQGSDGNSQHPPEDLRHGDAFIADIYNTLRANAALWNETLFVVLYDEHGGFYDHVPPPATVAPDGIASDADYQGAPFDFKRLGPRVPAIVASPWIASGVDPTVYDHTSVLAFVCDRFGLDKARLGKRVQQAGHFGNAPIWCAQARTDTPAQLSVAKAPPRSRALAAHETGLAAETRLLLQGLHAYLNGQDVASAWNAARAATGAAGAGTRDLSASLPRLGTLADEVLHALGRIDLPRPGTPAPALRPAFKPNEPLRLLCLHGIGHGDAAAGWQADPGWQDKWKQVITRNLQADGIDPATVQVEMLPYDDLFGDGPSKLQMLRAIPLLLRAMAAEVAGTRAFGLQIPEMLRWTAGMVVQWIEDDGLRDSLCQRLLDKIAGYQPHAVLAHSLGSLIGYDTLRRAVAAGGDALRQIDGRMFVSFGSQIAHPVVMREVWGGKVAPLDNGQGQGIAAWFHLYNCNDRVLTRPINTQDPRRVDIATPFDIPFPEEWVDLNHSADVYLDHAATRTQLWPVLARGSRTRSLGMPAIVTRAPVRRRRALLVGINDYPDDAMRLNGCVNDVFLVSRTLQQSGYDPSDIRLLLDERATRAEIAGRLEWLVQDARPGDERVFFYSGHGAQIPQYGAGGDADRMDETLVPYDFDWNDGATHFTDKTFREFYSHLPFGGAGGVLFNVILDCCHAGGMTRGGARVRGINPPNDIRHRMLRWDEAAHDWVGREWREQARGARPFSGETKKDRALLNLARRGQGSASDLRIVEDERFQRQCRLYGHEGPYMPLLMYAAREDELASEYDHGAQSYGAFTYALVEQIRKRPQASLTFTELVGHVATSLKRRHFTQQPELVGPSAVRSTTVPWKLT